MVGIAFQDDVKKAFSNVKDDILNLKRSVNRELLAVEEIGGKLQTVVAKEEFYSFIKRLGERLEKIEANLYVYSSYENDIKEVEHALVLQINPSYDNHFHGQEMPPHDLLREQKEFHLQFAVEPILPKVFEIVNPPGGERCHNYPNPDFLPL